jgi:predicted ABC-type ATPase
MRAEPFVITVLAGVNGAGKSSLGGALLQQQGGAFYNPDVVARAIRDLSPTLTAGEANALAWQRGRELLEAAIAQRTDFNLESTLGGETITRLLIEADGKGATLQVWFAGLANVDLHLHRIARRVQKGGHPIPEADVRRRWIGSRTNLIRLLPCVTHLRVYDNSAERYPDQGQVPQPRLVLSITNRVIAFPGPDDIRHTPEWAKPIVVAAFQVCAWVKRPRG